MPLPERTNTMKIQISISTTRLNLPMRGLLSIAALLTAGETMATQLIVNGGFELPVGYYVATTNLPGWYVSESVDIINIRGWPAYEGDQSLHLAGCVTGGAYIEQTFPTLPGQRYHLSFWYGNNIYSGPTSSGWVRVRGAATLIEELIEHSGSTEINMNYTHCERDFTADALSTMLRFTQPSTGCNGLALDAVSVRDIIQDNLTNGLVAYYPLNGNANDESGNGIDGVAYNVSPTTDRFGHPSAAMTFNGTNSYVDFGAPASLQFTGDFTITAWVNFTGGSLNPRVVSYGEAFGYELFTSDPSSTRRFYLYVGGNPLSISDNTFSGGEWHFVAARRSGATVNIFANGTFASTNTVLATPVFTGNLTLGRKSIDGFDNFWGGAMDEVRFYNRALSDSEVQQLYAYEATTCAPYRATATPTLVNGFVVGATISYPGCGYTNTPLVRFIGGGGSGAQAVAVVSNGVVTAVNVLNSGFGYTNGPLVLIEPPFIPNPVLSIAPMSFLSFSNLTLGGVYQLQHSVAWYWSNQPLSFTASNTLYTQTVAGVADSGSYRLALNPVPAQAFATPQVVSGFVVGAAVTSGGSGYVTSPAVTILGGGGTNATAVSHISGGVVTSITITGAGIGYTNTPTVKIAPPPAAAVPPTVQPVMRLDSANLSPYDNYQIQFKPDLGATWGNWNGGLFSPTAVTNSQYLFIANGAGFFRLRNVP